MVVKTKKSALSVCIGVVGMLALAAAIYIVSVALGKKSMDIDPNAMSGTMPGVDMAARLSELQGLLDDSKIAFSVNTSPLFETGEGEGSLMLENPEYNAKLLVAEVVLNDSGESVYTSGALRPGSYIENVSLKRDLPQGVYDATVYFSAYRLEDESFIGQTGAAVTITVAS